MYTSTPSRPPSTASSSDALAFLNGLGQSRMTLGLTRIQKLHHHWHNPHLTTPCIHIAGTNGKGSTAAMLEAILLQAGLTVGMTVSPHLQHPAERIRLNGQPITEEHLAHHLHHLQHTLDTLQWPPEDWPTYFETMVALAFKTFAEERVDIALIEVGLGGRLDATNIIEQPLLSIITHIGLDHQETLGETLAQIAYEKGGIIKPNCPVVLGAPLQYPALAAAKHVLEDLAHQHQAPIYLSPSPTGYEVTPKQGRTGWVSRYQKQLVSTQNPEERYPLPLQGFHQVENLCTVLGALEALRSLPDKRLPETLFNKLSLTTVQLGLEKAQWPARLQPLPEQPIWLDGSHNADGLEALRHWVVHHLLPNSPAGYGTPLVWLVSLKQNRSPEVLTAFFHQLQQDLQGITSEPAPLSPWHVICTAPGEADLSFHTGKALAQSLSQKSLEGMEVEWAEPLARAWEVFSQQVASCVNTMGVVTGSLYTAGAVLDIVKTPFKY